MKYTNKQISEIEESAKKRSKDLVHITDKKKFSTEDRIKFGICQHFVQYLVANQMSPTKMSGLLGIEKTRLSEITNYKFQKFTVGKLLSYLEMLAEHDDATRAYLRVFSKVAEMKVPSVSQSKKLYKAVEKTMNA